MKNQVITYGNYSDSCDGPRFHSREAAEKALGLLSDDEKAILIRGIA